MISSLTIKNYQSHADTRIDLAPLTVLVGPSSSGKSAVTRAIRALASNQSGKDFITHGESTMQVQAVTDRGTVTLTKGKPEDSYVVLESNSKEPRRYTKLGGAVPEDVTAVLGIASRDAVNFAGQFDMPYLLRTSASEVARVLGELTNVSAVFEAARESLRRKSAFAATLRTREIDHASAVERSTGFENLDAQEAAILDAEFHHGLALRAQERLSTLNDLTSALRTASAALKAAEGRTALPLPDLAPVIALKARLDALNGLITSLRTAATELRAAEESVFHQDHVIGTLTEEYDVVLREAGTCPTCGQDTKDVHAHA